MQGCTSLLLGGTLQPPTMLHSRTVWPRSRKADQPILALLKSYAIRSARWRAAGSGSGTG